MLETCATPPVLYDTLGAQHGWNAFKVASKDYPITDPNFTGFTRTISMATIITRALHPRNSGRNFYFI